MNDQTPDKARGRRIARIIGLQVGISIVIAVLLLAFVGTIAALSAFVGGAIAFVPAALYAGRMVAVTGSDPKTLLRAQYLAEAFKTATTLILFGMTFVLFRQVVASWLFVTYVAALLMYLVALLIDHQ